MLAGDLSRLFPSCGNQRVMCEVIDQSGDTLGTKPDGFHGLRLEEGELCWCSGESEPVSDAGLDFLILEDAHPMADDESLGEGFV